MARSERLFQEVREILLREWDPLGVADNPACRDEYDSYAYTLCRYLMERADEYRLAEYLSRVRSDSMGLGTAAPECDIKVARLLLGLRV
jgi:hypothetical protein